MNGVPAAAGGGIGAAVNAFGGFALQLSGDFLSLAIVFFVLALVAALVGQRGVAGMSMQIAKILVAIFLILAVISLLL